MWGNPFALIFGSEARAGEFDPWTLGLRTLVWGSLFWPEKMVLCFVVAVTVWGVFGGMAELFFFLAIAGKISYEYVSLSRKGDEEIFGGRLQICACRIV